MLTTILTVYTVFCYLVMLSVALLSYSVDPDGVTRKDWLIWIAAPVTTPMFLIFQITKRKN
jgi:hypothetical protein